MTAQFTAGQNKALITGIMDELSRGSGRPFVDTMADDFAWTLPGRNTLLKAHRTRERAEPAKTRAALKLVEQKIDYYDTWLTTGERPPEVPRSGRKR